MDRRVRLLEANAAPNKEKLVAARRDGLRTGSGQGEAADDERTPRFHGHDNRRWPGRCQDVDAQRRRDENDVSVSQSVGAG